MSYNKFKEYTNDDYLLELATLLEFAPLHLTSHLYDFTTLYLENLFIMHDETTCEYDVLKYTDRAFYSVILLYEKGFIIEPPFKGNINIGKNVIAEMIKKKTS